MIVDRISSSRRSKLPSEGWLFDPRFGYNAYVWTSQASQGEGAQVVVAGNLNYTFSDALQVFLGIQSVPSTRSTNRTFPYWLRNDNRPIADEYLPRVVHSGNLGAGKDHARPGIPRDGRKQPQRAGRQRRVNSTRRSIPSPAR